MLHRMRRSVRRLRRWWLDVTDQRVSQRWRTHQSYWKGGDTWP